jgi:hypothetical protein
MSNHKKKSFYGFNFFLLIFGIILIGTHFNFLFSKFIFVNHKNIYYHDSIRTSEAGERLNVSLHQSYYSTTPIEFNNLSQSNDFTLPCPTDPTFNSSYTELQVEDIFAPNKTLVIENEEIQAAKHELLIAPRLASFQVKESCYLDNVSVLISEDTANDQDFYFDVWNATYSGGFIKYNRSIVPSTRIIYNVDHATMGWETVTNWHIYLDTEKTYNNTFFITLSCQFDEYGYWHYGSNGEYDSIIWRLLGSYPELTSNDLGLIVDLSPENNTPKPSDVNLRVNGTSVSNVDNENEGYWISTEEYTHPSGQLEFELSADWWDLSCDITKTQINYTKTDIKASTSYEIPEPDLVLWNASIDETIDSFDSRIDDYNYIKFWVPENWTGISVFSGSVEKPVDISASAFNGYREVIVFQAENGVNWYLTASIDNRIPGNGGTTIPFGNYYLLFTIIILVSVFYFMKRKSIKL